MEKKNAQNSLSYQALKTNSLPGQVRDTNWIYIEVKNGKIPLCYILRVQFECVLYLKSIELVCTHNSNYKKSIFHLDSNYYTLI